MVLKNGLPHHLGESYLDGDKLHIGRVQPRNDALHGHSFLELVYVMEGHALHQLGAETSSVTAGDYFIVDIGSYHRYLETENFIIVNCLFAPEYMDRMRRGSPSVSALLEQRQLGAALSHPADRMYHDADGSIRRLFEDMEREYKLKEAGYQEIIRCHVTEVLVHAVRLAASAEKNTQLHPAAAAMAEYLYEHYAEPLSLDALSEKLGYTPQYLSALFHRETGASLSAYLQKLRVERSCRLLAETRLAVSAIAQEVGYCDLKHFNAIFRRFIGLSPREYRSRARGEEKETVS